MTRKITNTVFMASIALALMSAPAHADNWLSANKLKKRFSEITARDLERTLGKKKNQDFQGFEESDHRLLHMSTNIDPAMLELAKPSEHHYIERKFE